MRRTVSRVLQALLGRHAVNTLRDVKLWVRQLVRLSFYHPIQVIRRTELHGDADYGGWRICPDGIGAASVVYDLGVGEDISFAASLIKQYGLRVWAFDPTPKSIQWFTRQRHRPELHFHSYGVADFDGEAEFYLPDNPNYVSGTLVHDGRHGGGLVHVSVKRLATIMADLGHRKLDILKCDIEGAEYAVLRDVLLCGLEVDQILVEFHHAPALGGFAPIRTAIAELNRRGYRIFAAANGTDFSFIRA